MIKPVGLSRVIMAVAVLTLGSCGGEGNSNNGQRFAEVRYRMTVEVSTPDGVKSGSSVWSFALSPAWQEAEFLYLLLP